MIKNQKRNRERTGTFTHPEGPNAAATAMVTHLEQVYNGNLLPSPRPSFFSFSETELPHAISHDDPDSTFGTDEIEELIKTLPRRKAPGVDHLRAEMLVPIKKQLAVILSKFFELCWCWSSTPLQWRHAQVFPIFKKGDPTQASNYRPISLTSILRKLFEMVIKSTVEKYFPRIYVAQGGFKSQHSALDQAVCLHDLIQDYFKSHHEHYPVIAFLDIATAYDSVDRTIIWKAMSDHNAPAPLLGLLKSLFDNVSISVLIGNVTSTSFAPVTGVLQGSVLSPMLYSIYINSLPALLRVHASPTTTRVNVPSNVNDTSELLPINSLLFADDVAIFGTRDEVQAMLKTAAEHAMTLGYRWKPEKCAVINHPQARLNSVNIREPLSLYGVAIPQVDSFTYLGVPFNKKGIDNHALATQRSQGTMAAMSTLNRMGAHRSGFSLLLSARLYKIFIRPKFEYGLAISSMLKKDVTLLEKLQDRCLRLMVGGHPTSSTAALKLITDIPSVSWRMDVLITKYSIRTFFLPDDCLLKLLQVPMSSRSLLQSSLFQNRLFVSLPPGVELIHPVELRKLLIVDRQKLRDQYLQTTTTVLDKACRSHLQVDPILFLPATRTDRSRLIRWRMGWLPGKPVECICTRDHTSRRHFSTGGCVSIPSSVFDKLPHPLPGVNLIDTAFNMLPTNASKFCDYWPSLLELLWYVECCVSPSGYFKEDPEPGANWRDLCRRKPTTKTVTE